MRYAVAILLGGIGTTLIISATDWREGLGALVMIAAHNIEKHWPK